MKEQLSVVGAGLPCDRGWVQTTIFLGGKCLPFVQLHDDVQKASTEKSTESPTSASAAVAGGICTVHRYGKQEGSGEMPTLLYY